MRNAFAKELTKLASKRKDICLLSGDIGNRMFDEFKKAAPNRFLNCGIAEANMMSVASGMGLSGLRPFVYTITPFTTIRCLEQIKIGVAYHESPVIIIGTGSGLSYSELGPTHHSLEDLAILRAIPNINVLTPSDSKELVAQMQEALELSKPTYIRIGKKGEPEIYHDNSHLGIGKFNLLKEGSDTLVLAAGTILAEALEATKILEEKDISIGLAGVGGIKPLDHNFLLEMAKHYSNWISIEEHGVIGGLGSTLLEWISENKLKDIQLKRMGTPDQFINSLGSQNYTRSLLGIDKYSLVKEVELLLNKR